jgi:predicted N-formylglutamate amidohydrolase
MRVELGYDDGARPEASAMPPVMVFNAQGQGPYVLACDHASNRIPATYAALGLSPAEQLMHIAWDPGAFEVALRLSAALDAPLVASTVSRLVIDCNRHHTAPDLIPVLSERTEIVGNRNLSDEERQRRIASYHAPFHQALEQVLEARKAAGQRSVLATVHSFTPVYKDVARPWPIGLIHGADIKLTEGLRDALVADAPGLNVGWNEPYSARNGVTYTLEHHGDERGLDCTMIEIRNDEILTPEGIALWSDRLGRCLSAAETGLRT